MLYRSTDRLRRRGAAVQNLAHSASFDSENKDAHQTVGSNIQSMSPESGNRFRDNDMRKNNNLKRKSRIGEIATRFRFMPLRRVPVAGASEARLPFRQKERRPGAP